MRGRFVYVGITIILAIAGVLLGLTLSRGLTLLPAMKYGPANARFIVAFGARPDVRYLDAVQEPNRYLENMTNEFSLYVATLGANSYESVSTDAYPRPLTTGNINWYIHDYLFGFHPATWHGLPGAEMDVACHKGGSPQSCPGRIAYRDIISRGVIYELDALQVSEAEVERFFGSFRLVSARP